MAKLQTKISGSFRSEHGAKNFDTVRSYIETGRKHGANPFVTLLQLFQHKPFGMSYRLLRTAVPGAASR